jgi:hypothetical protein
MHRLQNQFGWTYYKPIRRRILQEANDTSNVVYTLTCKLKCVSIRLILKRSRMNGDVHVRF